MKGEPTTFWGKLETTGDGAVISWHPLIDHCADVAACCEAMLQHTLLRRRLARFAGLDDLSDRQVARLSVLAALHDVGKFNIGFQNKALHSARVMTAGHVRELLAMFDGLGHVETQKLERSLGLHGLLAWGTGEAAGSLFIASVSHHGRPCGLTGPHQPEIWRHTDQLDPFTGIEALARRCRSWFPDAFDQSPRDLLPEVTDLQHAFSGLIMLADWLGSDTRFFPYSPEDQWDRMPFARDSAARALAETHLDSSLARISLGTKPVEFSAVCRFEPNPAQSRLMDLPLPQSGSFAVIESETGSGKTEAALARFLRLFQAGLVDGMYFALPTRTAATQIHRRVFDSMREAFPAHATPPVILAVPGYLAADDHTATMAGFEVLWNDDEQDRFRFRGWAAERPKRYLAGAIAVGTIDQVLLSTLSVAHAHLRATSPLRQFLVVDEVHASDPYMTELLSAVLRFHVRSGGHVLLMSATLGSSSRHRLALAAGLAGSSVGTLAAECEQPYPLLTYGDFASTQHTEPVTGATQQKGVRAEILPCIEEPPSIARRAVELARRGAKVLVLRNTVADCIATQVAIEPLLAQEADRALLFSCCGVPTAHHARFAKEDRELLDGAIDSRLGRHAPRAACLVVTTQTVQQSLDLDADFLITDLCPMDVLLQRVGRLHRHTRDRPTGFEQPTVGVLVPPTRDLSVRIRKDGSVRGANGLGTVYDDLRVIETTWRLLETHARVDIPAMNRSLVERSTHPEALDTITEELGASWESHQRWRLGVTFGDARIAELSLVDRTQRFGEYEFPSRELERRAQVRLGEGDRVVEFPQRFRSPFGARVRQLTLPAYLARGAASTEAPTNVDHDARSVRFDFGRNRFIYDRLGLRRADSKAREEEDLADA